MGLFCFLVGCATSRWGLNPADLLRPTHPAKALRGCALPQRVIHLPRLLLAVQAPVAGQAEAGGRVLAFGVDPGLAGQPALFFQQGAGRQQQALAERRVEEHHVQPLSAPLLQRVGVKVPIYPGSWYDASMVALGRGLVPDAGVFFGPGGLMACRVSTFYVALKPRFDFTAAAPIPASLRQTLDEADTVQAMGVTVQRACGDGQPNQALRLVNTDPAPVIVAVSLETLA